jgi:putative flippase GtrA
LVAFSSSDRAFSRSHRFLKFSFTGGCGTAI